MLLVVFPTSKGEGGMAGKAFFGSRRPQPFRIPATCWAGAGAGAVKGYF